MNVSVNFMSIRQVKLPCHNYRNILVYNFHNPYIKLLRRGDYSPVNILFHNHHVYIVNDTTIFPKLIDVSEQTELTFKGKLVTRETVLQIVNDKLLVTFPFSINIYTSYTYMKSSSKCISNCMIGQYLISTDEPMLHIFITPTLMGDSFFMHKLDITNNINFQRESIFANPHLQEGNKTSFPHETQSDKTSNNTHCVCDHTKMERFFPPRYKNYKTLGTLHNKRCLA